MILILMILIVVSFIIYEQQLHRYYRKKMEDEKLISYFSQARMQLMKMLYTGEISHRTAYFNILMRATSYSIRAIYLYNNKEQLKVNIKAIESMIPYIVDKKMKNEFESLTVEQKELFVNTILRMIQLHIKDDFFAKAIFNMYIASIKKKVNSLKIKLLSTLASTSREHKQKISYLDDISNSYNIPRYAYA